MDIGDDVIIIGRVPKNLKVGNRSVVIGATDANGNTTLNKPMAVGYEAKAGSRSIAIGTRAGAGKSDIGTSEKKNPIIKNFEIIGKYINFFLGLLSLYKEVIACIALCL